MATRKRTTRKAPPERSPEQLEDALHEALKAKQARHELKQQIADGKLDVRELLDVGHRGTGDKIAGRLDVGDVILAINGVGPQFARNILTGASLEADVEIHPEAPLDQLSRAMVDALKAQLDLYQL